jgi:hypothetical protein
MTDSSQTDGGGFDAQKLAEEREKSSLSLNPYRLTKYGFSIFTFALVFTVIADVYTFYLLPPQFPRLGVVTLGGIVGFGFIYENDLFIPKRLLSTICYGIFGFLGLWVFPLFLPFRMRFSVLAIVLILSAVAGGFIWYYLRTEILSANFE